MLPTASRLVRAKAKGILEEDFSTKDEKKYHQETQKGQAESGKKT